MKSNDSSKKQLTGEKGIALLTAMFAILLLSAIAFGMMYMATAETQINTNFKDSEQAYFAARSGVEEVRERMRKGSANTLTGLAGFPATTPIATGGVLYLVNPDTAAVKPWLNTNAYFDTELAHENFYAAVVNPGTGVPCTIPNTAGSICVPTTAYYVTANSLASSNTMDFKWVRLNVKTNSSQNDMALAAVPGTAYTRLVDNGRNAIAADFSAPVCFDQEATTTMNANAPMVIGKPIVLPNGEADCLNHAVAGNPTNQWQRVYTITSLAVTPSGARRMVQADVARQIVPPLPAALTIDGPNPTYKGLTAAQAGIQGTNQATQAQINSGDCGTGVDEPSIGVFDANSANNVNPLKRPANYGGSPAGVNDIGPGGLNLLGPLGTVGGIKALLNTVTSSANSVTCSSATTFPACTPASPYVPPVLGTTGNPLITVVQGPFTLPASGSGILVVTGDFTMAGNLVWDGEIIVIGTGDFTRSGTSVVNGGVFVANIIDPANPKQSLPDSATPGSPNITLNGGGGDGGIFYNSCNVNITNNLAPFKILSMKEIQY